MALQRSIKAASGENVSFMIFLTLNVGLPFLRAAWAKKRASTWMLRCGLHVLRSKSGITIWQWPYSGTVRIKRDRVYLLQVTTSAQCCHLMKVARCRKIMDPLDQSMFISFLVELRIQSETTSNKFNLIISPSKYINVIARRS